MSCGSAASRSLPASCPAGGVQVSGGTGRRRRRAGREGAGETGPRGRPEVQKGSPLPRGQARAAGRRGLRGRQGGGAHRGRLELWTVKAWSVWECHAGMGGGGGRVRGRQRRLVRGQCQPEELPRPRQHRRCQQARALHLEVVRSLRVLGRRWMNPVTPQMGVPGLHTGHRGPWPRPIRLHVPAGMEAIPWKKCPSERSLNSQLRVDLLFMPGKTGASAEHGWNPGGGGKSRDPEGPCLAPSASKPAGMCTGVKCAQELQPQLQVRTCSRLPAGASTATTQRVPASS